MFAVFTGFDLVALALLSILLIGCDTKIGFILLWFVYFLFGVWFQDWTWHAPFTWATNHLFDLGMYIVAYLVIGGAWSIFKWYLFVLKSVDDYKTLAENYSKMQPPSTQSWNAFLAYNGRYRYPPRVSDNKAQIIDWISFWWYSMIRTVLGDWMRELVGAVYRMFYNVYDAIVKHVYAGIVIPKDTSIPKE